MTRVRAERLSLHEALDHDGLGMAVYRAAVTVWHTDSIANIAQDQFDNIMTYDFAIAFDEPKDEAQQTTFIKDTSDILSSCVFVTTDTLSAYTKEGLKDVNVIATGDEKISSLIDMHQNGVSLSYPADGSVAISDKLARIAGVSVGDSIQVLVDDTNKVSLPVSAIFENYVYHYMVHDAEHV
jgi:putative ABC transport system permease protein